MRWKIQFEINNQLIVKYFDHLSIPLLLLSTSGLMCLYAQGPVLKRSQSSIPNYVIHSPVPKYQWDLLYTGIAAYTGIIDGIILISGFYILIYLEFLHLSLKMICYTSLRENAKLTSLTQEYKTYTLVWIVLQS